MERSQQPLSKRALAELQGNTIRIDDPSCLETLCHFSLETFGRISLLQRTTPDVIARRPGAYEWDEWSDYRGDWLLIRGELSEAGCSSVVRVFNRTIGSLDTCPEVTVLEEPFDTPFRYTVIEQTERTWYGTVTTYRGRIDGLSEPSGSNAWQTVDWHPLVPWVFAEFSLEPQCGRAQGLGGLALATASKG
jgi:hypothetical protein